MPDREKIIKGLECCVTMSGDECLKCPYEHECWDTNTFYGNSCFAADALALLQEQEPVCTEYDRAIVLFSCRDCKTQLLYGQRYCHMCGRKIKWK